MVNVPTGLAAIAAAVRVLPADPGRTAQPIDLPGIATLSAGLVLLVLPPSLGRSAGWPA